MTTQNTEPEKIDTNETVVQQQSASETPIASPEVEVAFPVNMQDPQTDEIQSNTSEQQVEEESMTFFHRLHRGISSKRGSIWFPCGRYRKE